MNEYFMFLRRAVWKSSLNRVFIAICVRGLDAIGAFTWRKQLVEEVVWACAQRCLPIRAWGYERHFLWQIFWNNTFFSVAYRTYSDFKTIRFDTIKDNGQPFSFTCRETGKLRSDHRLLDNYLIKGKLSWPLTHVKFSVYDIECSFFVHRFF